jgi:DNA-binding CsgD family transcriptional regulator
MAMKRQPTRNVSISDKGVVQAVREPRHRMILELVRRMSRAAAPSDLVRLSGMTSEEVWRSVDALEAAGLLSRKPARARRREPAFRAVADAVVVGFDPQSSEEVAAVEEIHRSMVEHARSQVDAAHRAHPVGSGGLQFRAYVPMRLSASQLEELRRIMHLLHRFLETVGSGETIADPIEPQECNYQLMLELGRPCPGLLPMAPIAFAPRTEAPSIETRIRRLRLDELSPRERAVAVAMVDGRSRPEIAKELGVSLNTVASIGKRVYAKLGVRRRAQLASRLRP